MWPNLSWFSPTKPSKEGAFILTLERFEGILNDGGEVLSGSGYTVSSLEADRKSHAAAHLLSFTFHHSGTPQ